MKTDNIRIKRKNSDFLLFGFLYLLFVLIGIFLISIPFLSIAPESGTFCGVLVALGVICAVLGCVLYGMHLYRGIRPEDALIITNKGFTNRMVGGKEGVYVEWTNVASMKVFGLSKAPMLGLSLEDTESYLAALDGKHERDARANMEVGLPVISIAQRDVFVSINELKGLFSRMIKGAISWENYTTQARRTEPAKEPTVTAKPAGGSEELFAAKKADEPIKMHLSDEAELAEEAQDEETVVLLDMDNE